MEATGTFFFTFQDPILRNCIQHFMFLPVSSRGDPRVSQGRLQTVLSCWFFNLSTNWDVVWKCVQISFVLQVIQLSTRQHIFVVFFWKQLRGRNNGDVFIHKPLKKLSAIHVLVCFTHMWIHETLVMWLYNCSFVQSANAINFLRWPKWYAGAVIFIHSLASSSRKARKARRCDSIPPCRATLTVRYLVPQFDWGTK